MAAKKKKKKTELRPPPTRSRGTAMLKFGYTQTGTLTRSGKAWMTRFAREVKAAGCPRSFRFRSYSAAGNEAAEYLNVYLGVPVNQIEWWTPQVDVVAE